MILNIIYLNKFFKLLQLLPIRFKYWSRYCISPGSGLSSLLTTSLNSVKGIGFEVLAQEAVRKYIWYNMRLINSPALLSILLEIDDIISWSLENGCH